MSDVQFESESFWNLIRVEADTQDKPRCSLQNQVLGISVSGTHRLLKIKLHFRDGTNI